MTTTDPAPATDTDVLHRLSRLDRFLPAWIGAAMVLGLLLGAAIPQLDDWLDKVKIGTVSLPIAIGLLLMMYPVLAKVRYRRLDEAIDRRSMTFSLVLNWVVGPALMFTLAWLFLSDLPEYRTGLIIVGLARCIAMVLIWNDLACGDRELAAVLVAINSLFQIVMFSVLGWFYLEVLPGWLGLDTEELDVSMWEIAKVVLVFLGIPLVAGFLTRLIGERRKGTEWYEQRFLPRIGPVALYGLLFTIVVLFALQGDKITSEPWDVVRIALPLLAYFAIMWFGSFFAGMRLGFPYERNASIAFTAAGNNFELAIAVAIGVFGVTSGEALAGVVGPLIEVPVLVGLVYVALWARRRFYLVDTTRGAQPRHELLRLHPRRSRQHRRGTAERSRLRRTIGRWTSWPMAVSIGNDPEQVAARRLALRLKRASRRPSPARPRPGHSRPGPAVLGEIELAEAVWTKRSRRHSRQVTTSSPPTLTWRSLACCPSPAGGLGFAHLDDVDRLGSWSCAATQSCNVLRSAAMPEDRRGVGVVRVHAGSASE